MPKRKATHKPPTRITQQQPTGRTATSSIVIDHLAFPHIMDTIIAAFDYTALYSLARTCQKYYDAFYLGPHCIVTTNGTQLAIEPFHNPLAGRVQAAFHDDFEHFSRRTVASHTEWLGQLSVVDLKLDNAEWSYQPDASDENEKKLAALLKPNVARMKTFVPVNTKVAIYISNYIAKYDYNENEWVSIECANGRHIRSFEHEDWGTFSNPPGKIVLAVQYDPVRPAVLRGRVQVWCNEPIVVQFVKVDGPCLVPKPPETPVAHRFGADHACVVLYNVARNLTRATTVTVVGIESINPWQFNNQSPKADTAHLEPSREQQIRHLLANNPSLSAWHKHQSSSNLNIRFLTVDEYAKEVSPVMLALERGEGFTST